MKVLVTEYHDGDTKITPTETDVDKQNVTLIFPEEKNSGLQDGGILIR